MTDTEVFSIKDPRPITAKFRAENSLRTTEVYFSDESGEDEEDEEVAVRGDEEVRPVKIQDVEEAEVEESVKPITSKKPTKTPAPSGQNTENNKKQKTKKEKHKRKVKQRVNAYNSSSLSSIYIKSSEADSKTRVDKQSRSEQVLTETPKRKPKRKKKSPPISAVPPPPAPPTSSMEDQPSQPTPTTAESPGRKPNLDRISKLSEHKKCTRLVKQESWFNPNLTVVPSEEVMEDQPTLDPSEGGAQSPTKYCTPDGRQPEADPFSPDHSNRPRVRYTNLSLSMPGTREGPRRKEGPSDEYDAPGFSWLFECRNIWSNQSPNRHHGPGHVYNQGYPGYHHHHHQGNTTATREQQVVSGGGGSGGSYVGTQNIEVTNQTANAVGSLGNSCKTNSRFIHSMKNRAIKRGAPMRTVKQGSFVLLVSGRHMIGYSPNSKSRNRSEIILTRLELTDTNKLPPHLHTLILPLSAHLSRRSTSSILTRTTLLLVQQVLILAN
eukprot:sb/3464145/